MSNGEQRIQTVVWLRRANATVCLLTSVANLEALISKNYLGKRVMRKLSYLKFALQF